MNAQDAICEADLYEVDEDDIEPTRDDDETDSAGRVASPAGDDE